ncbi:hypothetical protein [Amycolatopsis sp. WGS_07]|uniref:hypothetical protein n=1 Tax=Amycolatopsis sp. WGS_07 TaxID=3076764 RepID=UPI003872C103
MDEDARVTNQILGPVTGGKVVQVGHADTVYAAAPPARSRYRHWVRQVAPPELIGRAGELAELAEFCTDPAGPDYVWWRAAPWTGKSALMATFVLNPPERVRVVSFFVTARSLGDDTREAFVDVVQEQLAEVLETAKDPSARNLHAVFADAAAHCRARGERLVLVVDGLDEDRGAGPGGHSIAALLPYPENGLRVIVASRLNPDVPPDVRSDHPLRAPGIERPLAFSPAAVAAKADMERELDALLRGPAGEQDLLGFLVAARGGLTSYDLAELTQRRRRDVERVLNSGASRSFTRRPAHWHPHRAPEIYLLGHENLRREAVEALGQAELSRYRSAIDEWADRYRRDGWPPGTPQFLLRGYFQLVQETGDAAALVELATDPARHQRMLDATGGDLTAMAELEAARTAVLASEQPDLVELIMLDMYRSNFRHRNKITPERLPATWAELGKIEHATALAQSMTEPAPRRRALLGLAGALVRGGRLDRAGQLLEDEHDPDLRDALLAEIAVSAAGNGEARASVQILPRLSPDRRKLVRALTAALGPEPDFAALATLAGQIADERVRDDTLHDLAVLAIGRPVAADLADAVSDAHRRARTRSALAHELYRRGEIAQARELALEWRVDDVVLRIDLVAALAAADDPAETIAAFGSRFSAEKRERVFSRTLVPALAETGRLAGIPDVLESLTNAFARDGAITSYVEALARNGDVDAAFRWAGRFSSERRSFLEREYDVRRYALLAETLLSAGDPVRAREAAERAEALARRPVSDWRTADAITALAAAVVQAGDVRRAELLAPVVRESWSDGREIRELANLVAARGDVRIAEDLVVSLELPHQAAEPLVVLARRLRSAGDHAALARLAAHVRKGMAVSGEGFVSARIRILCAVGEPADLVSLAAGGNDASRGLALLDGIPDLAARGEVGAALELCGFLEEHDAFDARRALVRELAAAGHVDQAEAVLESFAEGRHRDLATAAFLPELARHDLPRALERVRLLQLPDDRARLLVEIAEAAPAEDRRRILAEALALGHWSVIVPALDTDELAGLLDVADRFGALYRQEDPDA